MEKNTQVKTMTGKIIIGVSVVAITAAVGYGLINKNKTDVKEELPLGYEGPPFLTDSEVQSSDKVNDTEDVQVENNTVEDTKDEVKDEVSNPVIDYKIKVVVNGNSLNVRKGPDKNTEKIGSLPRGEEVKVISTSNGWSKIKYNDGIGYVASEYLADPGTVSEAGSGSSNTGDKKFENTLWSYSTNYNNKIARAKNVELASKRINNTVIKPGQSVSYKKMIGEITTANGYVSAPIMVNGVANQTGVGGGVCQVSTTLYAAALKSGLTDIVSRNHSGRVGYVPDGVDAVISGSQDLIIKNTYNEDIMISSWCSGGKINVAFKSVNPLMGGKTYDLRTYPSNGGLTVKLNVVEKNGGKEKVVYTRTSNYVR